MTTYLELTNKLLRRINEPEMNETQFDAAKGIHAAAKDAIQDTVSKINNKKQGWIFNAVEHTQNLVIGQSEYPWPIRWSNTDWHSFQIQKDSNSDIYEKLDYTERYSWYQNSRDQDYQPIPNGVEMPRFVFPAHGQGWGVSPSPDKPYSIKFRYFKKPAALSAATDICNIPEEWNYVINAGGLFHMAVFKNDPDKTNFIKQEFLDGLSDMMKLEVSWPLDLKDARVVR